MAAYEIGSCNAADPDNGYSFTKAVCTLRSTKHTFAFANFFVDAFNMLKNLIIKKEIPSDRQMKLTLELLIRYLMNDDTSYIPQSPSNRYAENSKHPSKQTWINEIE